MLSRTADHLFWMARYMERAAQAPAALGRRSRQSTAHAPACSGVAGPGGC
ncbi:alpha-E domain-containing protein [Caldimonas mangrovi]